MKLYLVQHAEAKAETVDPNRGLSDKGTADVERVARFLKPMDLNVGTIWHSGKTRARQTAEILSRFLDANDLSEQKGLAPNDFVDPIRARILAVSHDLMIVGHMPFLGKLVSLVVAGSDAADVIAFRQGGIVCLERDENGAWRINWVIVPDLLT
ncbi:MAG TPA: phosphohistidine phosphatase SixA [Desulfomonilaceae bacterium]|nr:phosphohistidine phosphatase SixA [Desulfomonilaceae bacterium]